jgi:Tfp pilus assembly protein PilX
LTGISNCFIIKLMKLFREKQSGQVALIVLLVMIVLLTIGISLASRSISDVRISQDEKEALRAFSAAEAGIENILSQPTITAGSQTVPVTTGIQANVTIEEVGEGASQTLNNGETMHIIFTGATPATSTLNINWIDKNVTAEMSNPASIEVIVYRIDYTMRRFAYNAMAQSNDFTLINSGSGNYFRQVQITGLNPATDALIRIRVLYNQATVMVNSNGLLPVQMYNINSQAQAEGEKIGRIAVERTVAILPPIFDYALFSNTNLTN